MIIIGSYAAKLGGFFPEWRTKENFRGSGDIDLVCRSNELIPYEHSIKLDLNINDKIYNIMEPLCESDQEFLELGWAKIATLEVVWATLYYTAGCVPRLFDKSFKDLQYYDNLVKQRNLLTEEHWKLANMYREDSVSRVYKALEAFKEK